MGMLTWSAFGSSMAQTLTLSQKLSLKASIDHFVGRMPLPMVRVYTLPAIPRIQVLRPTHDLTVVGASTCFCAELLLGSIVKGPPANSCRTSGRVHCFMTPQSTRKALLVFL